MSKVAELQPELPETVNVSTVPSFTVPLLSQDALESEQVEVVGVAHLLPSHSWPDGQQ